MNQLLNHILNIQTALAQPFQQTGGTSTVAEETGSEVTNLLSGIFRSVPYWITGFIVIVLSLIIARVVKSTVENKMTEAGMEEEHKEIQLVASRGASATVLLIGITAGLKIAGLDLTSIIAAAAFGVGFAMKDLIMNFISGIIVLLQKQFTIGDWIKVKGTMGIIQEIQSRYTVIKKFDGTKVIVPNSELFKNQVTSLTSNPTRRINVDLAIDAYMDLKEVIDTIYGVIDQIPRILKSPKPKIIVRQPSHGVNNLRIFCWVESRKGIFKPTTALVTKLHKEFYGRGWSWHMPTQAIVFDKDVPPDVAQRSRDYIERHKKALEKEPTLLEKQKQKMIEQEKKNQEGVPDVGTPAQTSAQAEQIGVGGPSNEVPVWLQQAAQPSQAQPEAVQEQGAAPAPQIAQMPAPEPQTVQQPGATVQNIEIGPEVKTFQPEQAEVPAAPTPNENLPVIVAPDVQTPVQPASSVVPPLVVAPDVQPPVAVDSSQNQ